MGLSKKLILSSKSTRRSMLRRRKKPNQPLILSLPRDLLGKILLKAGEVSHRQFRRTKRACHTFENVMEEPWYLRQIDLWEMDIREWGGLYWGFREVCLQHGNPSAMYLTGTNLISRREQIEEGLTLVRRASEQGYDLAIYANACLRRLCHPTQRFYEDISRAFVKQARKKLSRDDRHPWGVGQARWLSQRRDAIDLKSIEKCKCVPNSGWEIPFKPPEECHECFWKAQAWCFAEKLITGITVWHHIDF